ncbi:MAG: FkbM family methyltransferase [Bacteroidota bacterium]
MVNRKLIYDVGLHKGEDTSFYLKKGFKVVAFEANPDLADFCRNRFEQHVSSGQLTIVEGAILENSNQTKRKVKFYKNDEKSVWGTVVEDWAERNSGLGKSSQVIEVDAIDFSVCLEKYGIPYYMKIDIEGMDLVCLRALKEFDMRPSYISIESEKVDFDALKQELNLLEELGYSDFKAVNQSKVPAQKEPQNTLEGELVNHKFKIGSSGLFGLDLEGAWAGKEEVLKQYESIFRAYRLFGDQSVFSKTKIGQKFTDAMNRLLGIPGWYDTHARHENEKTNYD